MDIPATRQAVTQALIPMFWEKCLPGTEQSGHDWELTTQSYRVHADVAKLKPANYNEYHIMFQKLWNDSNSGQT